MRRVLVERPGSRKGYRWSEARDVLLKVSATRKGPDMLFRGQQDHEWHLTPSFDRLDRIRKIRRQIIKDKVYDDQLSAFADECLRHVLLDDHMSDLPHQPKSQAYEILQGLAQHHSLPTRFLDWSYSPLVAAFFAFDGMGSVSLKNRLVSVWCLDWEKCEQLGTQYLKADGQKGDDLELRNQYKSNYIERVHRYMLINERLRRQRGVFTWSKNGVAALDVHLCNISNTVRLKGGNLTDMSHTLTKINIIASDQKVALGELRHMGIDPASIMGDRDGVAKAIYNRFFRFP